MFYLYLILQKLAVHNILRQVLLYRSTHSNIWTTSRNNELQVPVGNEQFRAQEYDSQFCMLRRKRCNSKNVLPGSNPNMYRAISYHTLRSSYMQTAKWQLYGRLQELTGAESDAERTLYYILYIERLITYRTEY
jgi:hypothetical protein